MSIRSYIKEGYGFSVDKTTNKKIVKFLLNHIDTIVSAFHKDKKETKSILKTIKKMDDFTIAVTDIDNEEIQKFFEDIPLQETDIDMDLRYVLLDLISSVISCETSIPIEFFMGQEDCVGEDCIMIALGMPWNFNNTFRNMTREKTDTILMPYNEELNDKNTKDLDYLEVEYYG